MSYDLDMYVNLGGTEDICLLSENYTSNLRPVFLDIFDAEGDKQGLWVLDGKTGKRASQLIHVALIRIRCYREKYVAMEPDNRWGTIGSLVEWLTEIKDMCDRAPIAELKVS